HRSDRARRRQSPVLAVGTLCSPALGHGIEVNDAGKIDRGIAAKPQRQRSVARQRRCLREPLPPYVDLEVCPRLHLGSELRPPMVSSVSPWRPFLFGTTIAPRADSDRWSFRGDVAGRIG